MSEISDKMREGYTATAGFLGRDEYAPDQAATTVQFGEGEDDSERQKPDDDAATMTFDELAVRAVYNFRQRNDS